MLAFFSGMDISPIDLINIETFASKFTALVDYRKGLSDYLKSKMTSCAPNLSTLIGEQVGQSFLSRILSLHLMSAFHIHC